MKTFFLATLFACVAAAAGFSQEDRLQEIKTADGFTLRIPGDWAPIPKEILDAYTEAVFKIAPTAGRQVYQYGFQRASAEHWFAHPYVLIQVKRTGRVREAELKSLKQVKEGLGLGLAKAKDALSTITSEVQLGETRYDPSAHVLWTQIEMDVSGVGKIRGLVAVLLTEKGVIQIAGYAPDGEYAKDAALFESIVKNTVVSENLKYKPRLAESLPTVGRIDWGKILARTVVGALVGGLVGGLAGVVVWARKKLA